MTAAINELLALVMPARWAYEDIQVRHQLDEEGQHQLGFETENGERPIDVLFNTAELNLFTITLFLLCAPRCPKPLSLLVLDDPLQNMDELTVTTLARGLARLVRLPRWQETWRVLLFLHGEDDLERFRHELPVAVYRLPWLSPAEAGDPRPIVSEPLESTYQAELQDLGALFEENKT